MKKNILFVCILLGIVFCVSYIIKKNEITNSVSLHDSNSISLSFNEKSSILKIGESLNASNFLDSNNAQGKVIYIVNDEEIISVSKDGLVTAKKLGTAILSAIDEAGKSANMRITVIDNNSKEVLIEKIILSETSKTLIVGQTYKINYQVYPINATNIEFTFNSSNSNAVGVDNGIIVAKSIGTSIISVCSNNICSYLTINVINIENNVSNIKIYPSELTLNKSESVTLNVLYVPSNASDKTVKWTSSNENVAKVENGKVTGINTGTAYITAIVNGKSSDSFITVLEKQVIDSIIKAKSITLNKTSVELEIGETFKSIYKIYPTNTTNKNIIFASSNKSIFTVDSTGVIKAISSGVGTLNACLDNVCSKMKVQVKPKVINVSAIKLNEENINLKISDKKQLTATLSPNNVTNKSIIWISSDNNVVSVSDNGLVSAKKAGKVTITAITNNGLMAKANVLVLPNNNVFKYGEELNGTNNYCLSGGITSNRRYIKSDIDSELEKYMNNAYEYAKAIDDIEPLRAKVLAAAYFLGFNQYCRVRYMEGYEKASLTKGWYSNWTNSTGIDSVSFVKWAYYQVTGKNYERSILGRYKKKFNQKGLRVSDIIDVAIPGDVLVDNQYVDTTRVALILSIDKQNSIINIIHAKEDGIRIEAISGITNFTILTDMSRIIK